MGINYEVYGSISIVNDVMMIPEVASYTNNHFYNRIDVPIRKQATKMRSQFLLKTICG